MLLQIILSFIFRLCLSEILQNNAIIFFVMIRSKLFLFVRTRIVLRQCTAHALLLIYRIKNYQYFKYSNKYSKSCVKIFRMSHIFEQQNQMIIRFPEDVADKLHEFFDNGGQQPSITIDSDPKRPDEVARIALNVGIDGQQYKASVMQLPTISSTFKTIDRVNFFKSNDISQMIVVHENEDYVIDECDAQKVYVPQTQKVKKYLAESGITEPTKNIRQRFFRKKPKIDRQLVREVDSNLERIKQDFTNQGKNDEKGEKNKKKKNQSFE